MRIFGWVVFVIGILLGLLLLPLVRNVSLIGNPVTGYATLDMSAPIWILFVPLILIIVGMWLGMRKAKTKSLVCPNECNITQTGSKFCGQCGARLIWR
jgi:hypothetical protein